MTVAVIDSQTERVEEKAHAQDKCQYDTTDVDILTYALIGDPYVVIVAIGSSHQ